MFSRTSTLDCTSDFFPIFTSTHFWKHDGSEEYLVKWLSDERNYSRWLGSDDASKDISIYDAKDGLTKGAITKEIAAEMKNDIDMECNHPHIEKKKEKKIHI